MKYIPGLNGVRALAVLNVIFFHWGLPPFPGSKTLEKFVPNGNFGVNVFFVLSGFLISSILMAEKNKISISNNSNKKIITNFYSRRFLRIFPIYYLTLFTLYFSGLPDFQKNFPYYVSYTENFNVIIQHYWDSFCHTWSLSVEEQFYLIWPFVIIFTPKKRIVTLILILIAIGPVFSVFQTFVLKLPLNAFILTPSCFDAFGLGSLLAFYYIENNLNRLKRWIKLLLPISILLFFYWMFAPTGGHFQYFKRFFQSIIGCAMILFCLTPSYVQIRNKLLGNKILNWTGLVSYGLYLYHYTIPWFYGQVKQSLNLAFGEFTAIIDYSIMIIILLLITSFSYYLIERPILGYKKRFV